MGNATVDRRQFMAATALALMTGPALAQPGRAGMNDRRKISQIITDYIVGFDLKTVPQPVIERARDMFVDTVGVMLAGSREEPSHIVLEMVQAEGSAPVATVVGQSMRASPQLAAFANGVAAHAMDYDFTFMRAQSIAALIPAILPVAETESATPAEAIAAFIIGAEIAARIIRTDQNGPFFEGWHATGMVGVFAAAAASARLMKLPAAAIPDVLGISTALASGLTIHFGTMTKPLHSGTAARNGVMAAVLGKRGFTANANAFEGRHGFFDTFARGIAVKLDSFDDFGARYDLMVGRHRFKPYPCGGLTHTAIEAALALREKVGGRLGEVRSIHCSVAKTAGARAGTQYPTTVEAAKFSVGYLVPYALLHGAPKIAAFTERALDDDRLKALAKTVTASIDPDLGEGLEDSPAKVRVTMADGAVFEERRDFGSGSFKLPLTRAQFEDKFIDCATQVTSADTAKKIFALVNTLPEQRSFGALWPLLRKA